MYVCLGRAKGINWVSGTRNVCAGCIWHETYMKLLAGTYSWGPPFCACKGMGVARTDLGYATALHFVTYPQYPLQKSEQIYTRMASH